MTFSRLSMREHLQCIWVVKAFAATITSYICPSSAQVQLLPHEEEHLLEQAIKRI